MCVNSLLPLPWRERGWGEGEMHNQEREMDPQVALYFRNEFRDARDVALKDAEGYQQILFVLERFWRVSV